MLRFLACPALLAGLPLAAVVGVAWLFYVLGNGLVPGTFALGTVPVLLVAPAALASGWQRRPLAALTAGLVLFDVAFAGYRLAAVETTGRIAYCVDGACGGRAPFFAALVREDESANAGIELAAATGALFPGEHETIGPSTRAKYAALTGAPGPNALLLTSSAEHVTSLVYLPPGDDKVPAIVFLHGYGGLLTPYVSALLESPELARYAIIAPVYGPSGAWWRADGRAIVRKTLDTLPPRVDRRRVVLVGLSNGAVGASAIAANATLGKRFRAVVCVVGLGDVDRFGVPLVPMAVIAGRADARFPIGYVDEAAEEIRAAGGSLKVHRYDFDHMGPFTDTADVNDAIAAFIR